MPKRIFISWLTAVAVAAGAVAHAHPDVAFEEIRHLQFNDWVEHDVSFHEGAFAMVEVIPLGGPVEVHVLDADMNTIASDTGPRKRIVLTWHVREAGPHVILVANEHGAAQDYRILVRELFD